MTNAICLKPAEAGAEAGREPRVCGWVWAVGPTANTNAGNRKEMCLVRITGI